MLQQNLLTVPLNLSKYQSAPYAFSMLEILNDLQRIIAESYITNLTDQDVHNGLIFIENESNTNTYDVIFLGHQEYVTQVEYDNLRRFVANGGTTKYLMEIYFTQK
jgi:hypothetical protein